MVLFCCEGEAITSVRIRQWIHADPAITIIFSRADEVSWGFRVMVSAAFIALPEAASNHSQIKAHSCLWGSILHRHVSTYGPVKSMNIASTPLQVCHAEVFFAWLTFYGNRCRPKNICESDIEIDCRRREAICAICMDPNAELSRSHYTHTWKRLVVDN